MKKKQKICNNCDNYIVRNSASGSLLGYCEHMHKAEQGITLSAAIKTGKCKGFTPFVMRIL